MKKIEVNVISEELQKATEKITSVVNNTWKNQYLKMVEIEADNDKLTLIARQVTKDRIPLKITETILADVQSGGKLFIPAKTLGIFAKLTSNDENVNLVFNDENSLQFNDKYSGIAQVEVEGAEKVQKFFQTIENPKSFTVDCAVFKSMIEKVITAAETRANHRGSGVLLEVEGKKITLSATDKFQFAIVEDELQGETGKVQMLIPDEVLNIFCKAMSKGEVKVEYVEDEMGFSFTCGNTKLESKQYHGVDVCLAQRIKELIPRELTASAVVNRAELKSAVAGAKIFSKEHEKKILKFNFKTNDGLIIESRAAVGSSLIHCAAVASSDTTAAVDVDRLNRALRGIKSEWLMIGKATVGENEILTIHTDDKNFHYGIILSDNESVLKKSAENILTMENEVATRDEKIAEVKAEIVQKQQDYFSKRAEIDKATETLKAAQKSLRLAKNALKKAQETQKDAETCEFRQKAIDRAESDLAAAKSELETRKAEQKRIADWLDSFPLKEIQEHFTRLFEQVENAKQLHAERQKEFDWLKTVAA